MVIAYLVSCKGKATIQSLQPMFALTRISLINLKSKKMKQKLLSIKYRLVALWWFLTRKNYYLLSYNGRVGKTLESTNIVIPEFIEWVRKKHGVPTNHEIIMELKNIGNLCRSTDILAYNEIKALIEKLEK